MLKIILTIKKISTKRARIWALTENLVSSLNSVCKLASKRRVFRNEKN